MTTFDGGPGEFMKTQEDDMTVWHYRGYSVRFKNDGTQYYEIRRHGNKVSSKQSMLEAIQFINEEHDKEEE